ncbi:hypothetical protein [Streptomyces jumonjinensis]|uniref:Uncharacterized protein n=1 Tax=Streptomyces jumonjinensis TaxID=1945 RepID=A0A646KSS9_STRJU|nr:hypothetical protein [Streptomyces jumonjinensis]MQT05382.1 hypothetical protein [Streptomyces jumonjinensis]
MDTPPPPSGGPPVPLQPVAWATDPELTERLRRATQTLLDSLPTVMEDGLDFSDALHGGAQHVCDVAELDYAWAPMIEAEAVRAVTREAGHGELALFTPELSRAVERIESLPLAYQRRLVQRVADQYADTGPRPLRSVVATAVSPALDSTRARHPAGPNVLPFTPRPQEPPPRSPGR